METEKTRQAAVTKLKEFLPKINFIATYENQQQLSYWQKRSIIKSAPFFCLENTWCLSSC